MAAIDELGLQTDQHNIPGFKDVYITVGEGVPCSEIYAPMLKLINADGTWEVHGQDCAGGMGPADFRNQWSNADEAIQDILEFFFGDPARMARKAEYFKHIAANRGE